MMHQPVWLSGDRWNVAYIFDPETGSAHRRVLREGFGKTAGMGRRIGRVFVAVYVSPDDGALYLQVADEKYPLDGSRLIGHEKRLGGLLSELMIARDGRPPRRVKQWTVARAILQSVDPAYDPLDEDMDDFLAEVADIATSPQRREWILSTADPFGRPWGPAV